VIVIREIPELVDGQKVRAGIDGDLSFSQFGCAGKIVEQIGCRSNSAM
jgi:hypothetical protein